ncbi:MAG: hypothetical protein NT030_06520 [Candidatus Saganbacteria bacterium]|nr:hypothetical protein [Candidatus Saganbacteria bacterium]
MAETRTGSVDDILKQIEDFEKTVRDLAKNVTSLKDKLLKNKKLYGSDMDSWPEIK